MAGTLDAARSEFEKAGERQREIDGLIAVENKKLEALEAERKVKGRGRPNTSHSSKVKAAGAKIARLMRNILPSEQAPYVPRTMLELVSSAAKHPQHHAAATVEGRPAVSRARREGQAHVQLRRADVHRTESHQLLLAAAREQVVRVHRDIRAQQLVVHVPVRNLLVERLL